MTGFLPTVYYSVGITVRLRHNCNLLRGKSAPLAFQGFIAPTSLTASSFIAFLSPDPESRTTAELSIS